MAMFTGIGDFQSTFWARVDILLPPKLRLAGDDDLRRTRLGALAGQISSVSLLVSVLSGILLSLDPFVIRVNSIFMVAFALHPWVLRSIGSVAIFTNGLILLALVQQSILLFASGGSNLGALFSMPTLPLVAMLLSGQRSAVFFMLLCIASIVGLAWLPEDLFVAVAGDAVRPSAMAFRDAALITMGVTGFGLLYETVRSAALKDARTARLRAEQSERTFAKAFVANPESIFIASLAEGRIIDCNEGFLHSVGLASRNDAVGRRYAELISGAEALANPATAPGVARPILKLEFQTTDVDGLFRTFMASATRVEIGGEERLLVAAIDDTERRLAEKRILQLSSDLERRVQERTAELERVVRELESFSYSVSHDLRAPVRTIASFADVLKEDFGATLAPGALEHLGRIRSAAGRMGDLIDALLGLSRMSQRRLELEDTDLTQLAEEVIAELRENDPSREVEVMVEQGLRHQADSALTRVVLVNLLANAWKFTRDVAGARIEFGVVDGSGDAAATYRVRDNGVGFDMAYSATMFRAFQRVHTGDDFEGSGIGLATVERAVNRQGGRVWSEGTPGVGADFFFTLPRGETSNRAGAAK
jgi:signal transduction histidine kinase